jgi:urease accessory protein
MPANLSGQAETAWSASLDLTFSKLNQRTTLSQRRHFGPLRLQRALYPEGDDLCHAILLHPPGGIAHGDALHIGIQAGTDTRTLLTTPGASKWYRSGGSQATQRLHFELAAGACLEWLPQENIFFDGARAALHLEVNMAEDAAFIGLESHCLGREAMGERFHDGRIAINSRINIGNKPVRLERGVLIGGSDWLMNPAGLAGAPYFATLTAVGQTINPALLAACRAVENEDGLLSGCTLLPENVFIARCLAHDSQAPRRWFLRLWAVLRPALIGEPARIPRIWRT